MALRTQKRENSTDTQSPRQVLAVLMDTLAEPELVEEFQRQLPRGAEVTVISPAVEKTAFHHVLGDVDAASREAQTRLDRSLAELRRRGISARGQVGDSDAIVAVEDFLRQFPADEVLIVAHSEDQARWFEDGLFERAQERLYPTVRMIALRREEGSGKAHLVEVKRSGPGRKRPADAKRELELSPNLLRLTRGDLAGILVAIVGTIVAIVLAATGPRSDSAAGAAQILIAMAVALINMAHVVGLTLLESVGERGGLQRFFRNLSSVATPAAVLANLLLSLFG